MNDESLTGLVHAVIESLSEGEKACYVSAQVDYHSHYHTYDERRVNTCVFLLHVRGCGERIQFHENRGTVLELWEAWLLYRNPTPEPNQEEIAATVDAATTCLPIKE